MNVYEKLNLARVKFQSSGVKKSGKNSYAGYSYYELSDILPVVNGICSELKATCLVSFEKEIAKLEFTDCEKPEDKIVFTSPMSEASLKGCHAVQNLGAVETYIKRYLYQNCFEIVESDVLDATMGNEKTTANNKPKTETKLPPKKKLSPEEEKRFSELVQPVMDYINSGLMNDDFSRKAQFYIDTKDVDGLEKTLAWCKTNCKG